MAFLRLLRLRGPWLLTAIVPNGRGKTETRTAETEEDVRLFVQRYDSRRNIYYSLNPAKHALLSKAKKADIAVAEYVHADLDPRDDETPEDAKARYMERLAVFEPCPTAVIDTGNGIQALWRLEAPLSRPPQPSTPPEKYFIATAGRITRLAAQMRREVAA
jgi:hypothetical protein